MPVYSASSTQWPLLQSKTEQKFKSGLFNVSAEFIRPVGNSDLPTEIETSIGPVDVWPDPTVSVGTDGFERINATGYGVWDSSIEETVTGLSVGEVGVSVITTYQNTNGNWDDTFRVTKFPVYFEMAVVKKMAVTVPVFSSLKIYNQSSADITNAVFNVSSFFPIDTSLYTPSPGSSFERNIVKNQIINSLKLNFYGAVKEIEASFAIRSAVLDFGVLTLNENPNNP